MKSERIEIGSGRKRAREQAFRSGRLEVLSPKGVGGPDRVLLDALPDAIEGRVLVVGTREALAAIAVARLSPSAEVHLFAHDGFEMSRGREALRANDATGVHCRLEPDLPDAGTFDWVVLAVPRIGDAALAAELIREAHGALKPRGKIMAATDNPRDRWLHDRVLEAFGAVTIHLRAKYGLAYIARKQSDHVPRERNVRREFEATLFGQKLALSSRPGVFSHGELDDGTLALSEVAQIQPSSRTIDIGCGSGAIGIAAALAAPGGLAVLVDSSARAAHVARENALRNGAGGNSLVALTQDMRALKSEAFDAALANPPYFGDYRITELFAEEARRMLVPGGKLWLVTKALERPFEIVRELFGAASVTDRRGYAVITATKR